MVQSLWKKKRTDESVKRSCKEVKNRLKTGFVDLMPFVVQRPHRRTELIQCGQCDNRGRYTVPIYNCQRKEEILIIIGSCVYLTQGDGGGGGAVPCHPNRLFKI